MSAENLIAAFPLRLGTGRYDRVRPIAEGRVAAPCVDWRPMPVGEIPGAFARGELDLAEISFGELLTLREAGQPVRALPVFLSQGMRHDTLYVAADSPLRRGEDLDGARIGATLLNGTTVVWVRDALERQYGLSPERLEWHVGPLDRPSDTVKVLPAGPFRATAIASGETQVEMLLRGDLDVILSYKAPDAFKEGRIRRLFVDPRGEWQSYQALTGCIPLLHVLAMNESVTKGSPDLPEKLFRAFVAARDLAVADLKETAVFTTSLPHLSELVEEAQGLFPEGLWPYGLDGAGRGIEAFLDMALAQGLVKRLYRAEEVFFPLEQGTC